MEIEAKFIIPDKETCKRLQETDQLAGFLLSTGQSRKIHDFYLDTAEQAIKKAGYACRKREQGGRFIITLKQLVEAEGAIHRREESEISLPADIPPEQWPASSTRDLILHFIKHDPLITLFGLSQTRFVRLMRSHSERLVAELSIDEVRLNVTETEQRYFELEVELRAEGTEYDLEKIRSCLHREWALHPEGRSKFERALTLINTGTTTTSRAKARTSQNNQTDEAGRKLSIVNEQYNPRIITGEKPIMPAVETATAGMPAQPQPQRSSKKPGLKVDDTMAEGARKTLYFHFQRMVQHEPGVRRGEDIEELHDMRVATRRMRAAIRVFGEYLDMNDIKPFARKLRRVGRTLGAVRDLDVFKQKTQAYIDTLPPQRQGELAPLLSVMDEEHKKAREQMLSLFDSYYYERFKKRFAKFLKKPGAAALPAFGSRGELLPQRIRHVLPAVLYQRLAAVWAYEALINGPDMSLERLHKLRIAFKGLRYTLEFFREVLHSDTAQLIEEIKTLQDHLGGLQDAVVTCNILRDFLTWGTWGKGGAKREITQFKPVIAPGVVTYLAARQTELQHLADTFPAAWARMQQTGFAKKIAEIVQDL